MKVFVLLFCKQLASPKGDCRVIQISAGMIVRRKAFEPPRSRNYDFWKACLVALCSVPPQDYLSNTLENQEYG